MPSFELVVGATIVCKETMFLHSTLSVAKIDAREEDEGCLVPVTVGPILAVVWFQW